MSRRPAASTDESSTLAAYLREIAKIPRLDLDEERALAERIQDEGDEIALTRLIESNLRFVASYARRYRGFGVSVLDLIHEGNLGLIEAARRFDPWRDDQFVTYAAWWVRESMLDILPDQTRALSAGSGVPLVSRLLAGPQADATEEALDVGHDAELYEGDAALFALDHEIGDTLQISRERVRHIESRARERLQRSAKLRSHLN